MWVIVIILNVNPIQADIKQNSSPHAYSSHSRQQLPNNRVQCNIYSMMSDAFFPSSTWTFCTVYLKYFQPDTLFVALICWPVLQRSLQVCINILYTKWIHRLKCLHYNFCSSHQTPFFQMFLKRDTQIQNQDQFVIMCNNNQKEFNDLDVYTQ